MLTRFMKLPIHDHVLIGRDLNDIFKNGHIYEVHQIMGEIIIKDLGKTSLPKMGSKYYPNEFSSIEDIMCGSSYLLTEDELKIIEGMPDHETTIGG